MDKISNNVTKLFPVKRVWIVLGGGEFGGGGKRAGWFNCVLAVMLLLVFCVSSSR